MLTEPDVRVNAKLQRFRPRPSEGSSNRDPANRPEVTDSSDEEAEVFIGPAITRLFDREDPPDYTVDRTRSVGPVRRSTVCRYYLSKTGCQRAECTWKHENPKDQECHINTLLENTTNSSVLLNGKIDMGFSSSSSNYNQKMKELHIQNKSLAIKNQELESKNHGLKSLIKDMQYLEEENLMLRRLLRKHFVDQGSASGTHPSPPRSSAYFIPSKEYGYPIPSWSTPRTQFARPFNDYNRLRFFDSSSKSGRSDPGY